jgi:hypothetical protein
MLEPMGLGASLNSFGNGLQLMDRDASAKGFGQGCNEGFGPGRSIARPAALGFMSAFRQFLHHDSCVHTFSHVLRPFAPRMPLCTWVPSSANQ